MPKNRHYDYDDDDYDDDYCEEEYGEEPEDYVRYVSKRLDQKIVKANKIDDRKILRKLEHLHYDADETVKYFNSMTLKVSSSTAAKTKTATEAIQRRNQQGKAGTTTIVPTKEDSKVELLHSTTDSKDVNISSVPSSVFEKLQVKTNELAENLSDDDYDTVVDSSDKNEKPHLTLVVAGHVDAGKSTLVGNLLSKVGVVSKRVLHKYANESKAVGKASFHLAWVMDETSSEREHGVTIGLAEKNLELENVNFSILDAPGHRDFIINMIKGAMQADVAMLIVPAGEGEFESAMKNTSQTIEHAILLKALGANQIIVVVNKMDSIKEGQYKETRYKFIESQLRKLLQDDLHFNKELIRFVPLSGLLGDNIAELSEQCPMKQWYKGPTLINALNSFRIPPSRKLLINKPTRIGIIENLTPVDSTSNTCTIQVMIIEGKARVNKKYGYYKLQQRKSYNLAAKTNDKPVLQLLRIVKIQDEFGNIVDKLVAGDRGTLQVTSTIDSNQSTLGLIEGMAIFKGISSTINKSNNLKPFPLPVNKFKASISVMKDIQIPIIPGATFEFYISGLETECQISKIHKIVNKDSNTKGKIKCITGGLTAVVTIKVATYILLEPYDECRALGRFVCRSKGNTIAVGVCTKVKDSD